VASTGMSDAASEDRSSNSLDPSLAARPLKNLDPRLRLYGWRDPAIRSTAALAAAASFAQFDATSAALMESGAARAGGLYASRQMQG
jgi:hypothetical protein